MKTSACLALVAFVSTAVGCSKQEPTDAPRFRPTVLPTSAAAGDCDTPGTAPALCDWANSVDAIVVGDILSVEPILKPLWVFQGTKGDPYLQDDGICDGGFINIGIIVNIKVTEVLYGDVNVAELAVHIGQKEVDEWSNIPTMPSRGTVEWIDPHVDRIPLPIGTTAGFPLVYVEEVGKWSLRGSKPFTFDEDGKGIFVQEECGLMFGPPSSPPADFWALETDLAACGVARNEWYDARFHMQPPHKLYASICQLPVN